MARRECGWSPDGEMQNSRIRRVWRGEGVGARLLWLMLVPLSWLYGMGVQIRNFGYSARWLRARALDRYVVSVGNLTVGGTGKTPTCLWLADELSRRGLRLGILSRGDVMRFMQLRGELGLRR